MQGVKQSACLFVVVVIGTKIARSCVLGVYACCKHNQSVDISEKLVCTRLNCSKKLSSATNHAFSIQHACGLLTTPTLLAYYGHSLHPHSKHTHAYYTTDAHSTLPALYITLILNFTLIFPSPPGKNFPYPFSSCIKAARNCVVSAY